MTRLLPIALLLLVTGCSSQLPKNVELPLIDAPGSKQTLYSQLTPGKFEPSVMSIGGDRDLAQQRVRGMGFVQNSTLETYLNEIRQRLLIASGITDVPGRVLIEANTALGGNATADGNIIIPMAWIPDAASEDELAALIAHELAHVLLKHQSTDLVGLTQKRLQSAHEMLVGTRMSAANTTQVSKKDTRALLAAQVSIELLDKVAMPAWNRRQETEADLLGLDLMLRAGYSPEGMPNMLKLLQAFEETSMANEASLQTQLKEFAVSNPDKALQTAWDAMIKEVSRKHPETDKRIEAVTEYHERHYGDQPQKDIDVSRLGAIKAEKTVKPLIRNFQHTIRARRLLAAGKANDAYKEALQGVQPPTAKEPLPHWVLWQTARAIGRQGQHQKSLEMAIKSPEPIFEVYKEAIADLEHSGKFQDALNIVLRAEKAFGDAPNWMPDRIRLTKKLGRKEEANALALKCGISTPELRKRCYDAAKT